MKTKVFIVYSNQLVYLYILSKLITNTINHLMCLFNINSMLVSKMFELDNISSALI